MILCMRDSVDLTERWIDRAGEMDSSLGLLRRRIPHEVATMSDGRATAIWEPPFSVRHRRANC